MSSVDMCANCRHAVRDYAEYFGGQKYWFVDGCKKDLEPVYDEEQESYECEGYRNESGTEDQTTADETSESRRHESLL